VERVRLAVNKRTGAELREIAAGIGHEAVKGYSQLNKEHLLAAMCKAMGIDMHAHRTVVADNKADIKGKIKLLKAKRDEAVAKKDYKGLKQVRRRIHLMKRELHKAAV
jgi:hypothetical protein